MKIFTALACSLFALSALSTAAPAAPKAMKSKMPMTMTCPVCHMAMPSKKTAKMSVPVPIKGHTYYCCTECAAGKAHMKAMKTAKPAKKM